MGSRGEGSGHRTGVAAHETLGKLSYASFGSGSGAHLGGELFKLMAGIDLLQVPYKGGGPAIADTIASHVPLHFAGIATALPHIRTGKLHATCITARQRSKLLPELPAFEESGLAGDEAVVAFIEAEIPKWAKMTRDSGARVD